MIRKATRRIGNLEHLKRPGHQVAEDILATVKLPAESIPTIRNASRRKSKLEHLKRPADPHASNEIQVAEDDDGKTKY